MRIDVVTIFPDYLEPLRQSLPGRAFDAGIVELGVHDLRRWTDDVHPEDVEAVHRKWRGSELLRVGQGHFGYRMMRETMAHLTQRLAINPANSSR